MLEARRHKTFKIKMGFGGAETETRRVVRTARAIHQLAPEAIVTVDLNQAWDMTTCMRLLPQMDYAGIAMVEQPLPFWNKDGLAALCSRLWMAVIADEGLWDLHDDYAEIGRAHVRIPVNNAHHVFRFLLHNNKKTNEHY